MPDKPQENPRFRICEKLAMYHQSEERLEGSWTTDMRLSLWLLGQMSENEKGNEK